MDVTTIFIIVLEIIVITIILFLAVKGVRVYIRRKKVNIKTPKVRGRNILIDNRFGSAIGVGYEPIGIGLEKAIIHLLSADGHVFSVPYHKDELIPDNSIQAFVGAQRSIWRLKGQNYIDKSLNDAQYLVEKQNKELKEEEFKQKAKMKIAINEAATIPDKMEEIIKEFQKPRQQESIRVLGK